MNKAKKMLCLLVAMCLLLAQFPAVAHAAVIEPGEWSNGLEAWEFGDLDSWLSNDDGAFCGFDHGESIVMFSNGESTEAEATGSAVTALTIGGTAVVVDGVAGETLAGEGWSYDPESATLTLNNFRYENHDVDHFAIEAEGDITIALKGENVIDITVEKEALTDGKLCANSIAINIAGNLNLVGDAEGKESLTILADNTNGGISALTATVTDCEDIRITGGLVGIMCQTDLTVANCNIDVDTLDITQILVEAGGWGAPAFCGLGGFGTVVLSDSVLNVDGAAAGFVGAPLTIERCDATVSADFLPIYVGTALNIEDSQVSATNTFDEDDVLLNAPLVAVYASCDPENDGCVRISNSTVTVQAREVGIIEWNNNIEIIDSTVTATAGYIGMVSKNHMSVRNSTVKADVTFTAEEMLEYAAAASAPCPPSAMITFNDVAELEIIDSDVTATGGLMTIGSNLLNLENSTIDATGANPIVGFAKLTMNNCSSVEAEMDWDIVKTMLEAGANVLPAAIFSEYRMSINNCKNIQVNSQVAGIMINNGPATILNSDVNVTSRYCGIGGVGINASNSRINSKMNLELTAFLNEMLYLPYPIVSIDDGEFENCTITAYGGSAGMFLNGYQKFTNCTVNSATTWDPEIVETALNMPAVAVWFEKEPEFAGMEPTNGEVIALHEGMGAYALVDSEGNFVTSISYKPTSEEPVEPETTVSGTCGENVEWTLDLENGELAIYGVLEVAAYDLRETPSVLAAEAPKYLMDDFTGNDTPWAAYAGLIASVVVDDLVSNIGNNAFSGCENLEKVVIGNAVEVIGEAAFADCYNLETVSVGESVKEIADAAFAACQEVIVSFTGDKPEISETAFENTKTTVEYSEENTSWDDVDDQTFGENVETKPVHIHKYDTKVTDPTCTKDGYTTYTCACGYSYDSDVVKSQGHKYDTKVTDPTCTEDGYTTYTCACGDSYVSDEVKSQGHKYDTKVTDPTCTEDGYTTYTCACGDSYVSDEVKSNGHSFEKGTCTVCGAADPDYKEPEVPEETDPTTPSVPEETDPTTPSVPEETDPTTPTVPEETKPVEPKPENPKPSIPDVGKVIGKIKDLLKNLFKPSIPDAPTEPDGTEPTVPEGTEPEESVPDAPVPEAPVPSNPIKPVISSIKEILKQIICLIN